jgi:hypothetical protein
MLSDFNSSETVEHKEVWKYIRSDAQDFLDRMSLYLFTNLLRSTSPNLPVDLRYTGSFHNVDRSKISSKIDNKS